MSTTITRLGKSMLALVDFLKNILLNLLTSPPTFILLDLTFRDMDSLVDVQHIHMLHIRGRGLGLLVRSPPPPSW